MPIFPEGFIAASQAIPTNSKPVLAVRSSSVASARFEVLTARYNPEYPRSQWRTLDNDAITESGANILAWRDASDWINPPARSR